MRVNWERLEEAPFLQIFNSHLWKSFSGIPLEVGGIEPEWAMSKTSIAEAVSCGLKILGSSRSGNPQTPWWTPVVREAFRLKNQPSGICYPGGLLMQLQGTDRLEVLQALP